ncbi:hypothetical protein VP01_148g7 [Puccinia sorghi]|uniref:Uncharacterized protein n=1 Tax=Puccinia sorghi TaxID=27349 RepID=A0A0L6VL84_9BASI|nr:hypothetical protein VP01_148g7 [Puccinia sorghi]
MENLHKVLADHEAKVEGGFLQLYRWRELDRTEREAIKNLLSGKVDIEVFERLSEAQKECANQISFRLQSKIGRMISKQKCRCISPTITKKLEEIVEELTARLRQTESSLNSFKCDEYPREMNFVKSGLEKVVNDLKEFLGETLANNSFKGNVKNGSSGLISIIDSSSFIRNRNYEVIRLASTLGS